MGVETEVRTGDCPASHLVDGVEHVSSVQGELHLAMTKNSKKLTEGLLSHQRTQPEHSLPWCSTVVPAPIKDRFFQDDAVVLAIHSEATGGSALLLRNTKTPL